VQGLSVREFPRNEDGVTRPLMATKLYVPRLRRGHLARPRLLERMGHGAEARLTQVHPAGFGKTTVLAAWLHEGSAEGRCVAWLSLDAADNEPAPFWTYVVTALRGGRRRAASSAWELRGSRLLGGRTSSMVCC
jgi:LuxR family maltose regulon positive regulatory protein